MRMTRAEAKERNRQALLDAAREVVAKDGYRAKLDEIAEAAGVTTGAIYSLFGSKNGLLIALVTDYLGPHYNGIEGAVSPSLQLVEATEAFARRYHRLCEVPDALRDMSFEISLHDLAIRDLELRAELAAAVQAHEERLAALLTGKSHDGAVLTQRQAQRLATALRALLAGLSQRVILGLTHTDSGQYFADTALALITPAVLGPP